jgi:hypothetical protein
MSRKAITLYAGTFVLGLIAGLITYLDYRGGSRAVEETVPGTNAIPLHIGIAVVLVLGIILIDRRIRKDRAQGRVRGIIGGDGGFWRAPFTEDGWRRLLFALLALPVGILEFVCSLASAMPIALKIERWRLNRLLRIQVSPTNSNRGAARRYFFIGLPIGLLLGVGGYVAIFTVWRAGLQVLGALDPNFCVNAWGGPSCLGASLAHWMDAFIIFYASIVVVRLVSSWQGKLAERLLSSAAKTSEP